MPLFTVPLSTAPDAVKARQIAETLTDLTATILGKKRALTAMTLDVVPPASRTVGGHTLAEQELSSFALTIRVTAGTNSPDEKAAYIAAVFARMSELLGPLHEASYVTIQDVAADSWGYGGRTQEDRASARLAPSARLAGG